jgi:hypothetical protein
VGSSINLGVRLNVYFINSYLKLQSNRGSAICRALLKSGHSDFLISIETLGSTSLKTEKAFLNTDFVVKEKNYLDNYIFDYNVNRGASTISQPSNYSINIGSVNLSYVLYIEYSFSWNRKQSP